ncbi:hypothetical protein HY642_06350 [Candidatus Woesearchaeota archaeon]|nr:hypothetical protein [Candidatus Woesearchaeota archaeon]
MMSPKEKASIVQRLNNLITDVFWVLHVDLSGNCLESTVADFAGDVMLAHTFPFCCASTVHYKDRGIAPESFGAFCRNLLGAIRGVEQPAPEAMWLRRAAYYAGQRSLNGETGTLADYELAVQQYGTMLGLPLPGALCSTPSSARRAIDEKLTALACTKHYYEDLQIEGLRTLHPFRVRRDGVWAQAFKCSDIYTTGDGLLFRNALEQYANEFER